MDLSQKILFVLASLVLPVGWGVLVNWLFDLWRERQLSDSDDDPVFPDYQI